MAMGPRTPLLLACLAGLQLALTPAVAVPRQPPHRPLPNPDPAAFGVARMYGSHMVLQHEPPAAKVWGYAAPGSRINATLASSTPASLQATASAVTGADGRWLIVLPPQPASKPGQTHTLSLASSASSTVLHLEDLLFGDVFVCAGQSNAEFPMEWSYNASAELQKANTYAPFIRAMRVAHNVSDTPLADLAAEPTPWARATNVTAAPVSAVCYYTAQRLYDLYQVPYGILQSTWSGVPIETYSSADAMARCSDEQGENQPGADAGDGAGAGHPLAPSVIWNAMVHPLVNTTVRGVLWYQGEANSQMGLYSCRFAAMIADWRAKWGLAFPFGFVQLSTEGTDPAGVGNYPAIRWAQTAEHGYVPNQDLDHVFMATAVDLGDPASPYGAAHPRYKRQVGLRLAHAARAVVYGEPDVYVGPRFSHAFATTAPDGSPAVNVSFSAVGTGGLVLKNPFGFEVCGFYNNCTMGQGGHFFNSTVVGHAAASVLLSIPAELGQYKPVAVRYLWREACCQPWLGTHQCALYAVEQSLPVTPFFGRLTAAASSARPSRRTKHVRPLARSHAMDRAGGASHTDPGTHAEGAVGSVTQNNITFFFDKPATVGRYANGDYWAVGPVTVTRITPEYTPGRNGFELNTAHIHSQGLDDRISGFNASLVPTLPLTVAPGSAVVKAISVAGAVSHAVALEIAVVLTVVASAPSATAFRPPYFGNATTRATHPAFSTTALQMGLLPNFTAPAGCTPPNASWMEQRFLNLQLDHLWNYVSRQIHPIHAMPNYGADIARQTGDAALKLMLPASVAAKTSMSIGYVQYGIDLYGILKSGGGWPANGGHGNGRKLPVVFAALLLQSAEIAATIKATPVGFFSEDGELTIGSKANIPLFGRPDSSSSTPDDEAYWNVVVTGDGDRIISDPYGYIDGGAFPGSFYQFCCTSMVWKGTALPVQLWPAAKALFNSPSFLTYVSRWTTAGAHASPDPCAPPTGTCSTGGSKCTGTYQGSSCGTGGSGKCQLSMAGYGTDFGPDGKGGCIPGKGRFPNLPSTANQGYDGSQFADAMWRAYNRTSLALVAHTP